MTERTHSASTKYAVIYQSMYLANLLLLPGVFFIILLYYFYQYHQSKNDNDGIKGNSYKIKMRNRGIGKIHLIRSIQLSVVAGVLLAVIPLLVICLSSQLQTSIMVGLVYFVIIHAGFVLIGMFNLSRAMTKKAPVF